MNKRIGHRPPSWIFYIKGIGSMQKHGAISLMMDIGHKCPADPRYRAQENIEQGLTYDRSVVGAFQSHWHSSYAFLNDPFRIVGSTSICEFTNVSSNRHEQTNTKETSWSKWWKQSTTKQSMHNLIDPSLQQQLIILACSQSIHLDLIMRLKKKRKKKKWHSSASAISAKLSVCITDGYIFYSY